MSKKLTQDDIKSMRALAKKFLKRKPKWYQLSMFDGPDRMVDRAAAEAGKAILEALNKLEASDED